MQHAPPEDPDSLPLDIEERVRFEPPGIAPAGEVVESRPRQFQQPEGERFGRLFGREHARSFRLGATEELGKKTALGQKLMAEDFEYRTGFRMRTEGEIVRLKLPEYGSGLVGLTGVRFDRMLQQGIQSRGDFGFGNHISYVTPAGNACTGKHAKS